MKNDLQNMEARYRDEKKQLDKRWQETLDSARRERDETEQRSVASIAQAEINVAYQQERLNDLMNQMRIDRDHAQRERNNMQERLANANRRRSSFCIVQRRNAEWPVTDSFDAVVDALEALNVDT